MVVNEHTQELFLGSGIKQYVKQKYTGYDTIVSNSLLLYVIQGKLRISTAE